MAVARFERASLTNEASEVTELLHTAAGTTKGPTVMVGPFVESGSGVAKNHQA